MNSIRFVSAFILVCLFLCLSQDAYSQSLANDFQFPLDNYPICQYFGHNRTGHGVHTGEDVACGGNSSVKAIANGKVLFAQTRGSVCDNWGYVLVIEHTTRFGKINSIYGHIDSVVREGDLVTKGQVIGTIGDFAAKTSCGWSNHLHFGIYNGPFGVVQGTYPPWLNGYLSVDNFPSNYITPTDFLNCQANAVSSTTWQFFDRSGSKDRAMDLTNSQCWIPKSGATTVNFDPPGAWILKLSNDPQIISPPLSVDTNAYKGLTVKMASLASNRQLQVFFATDSSPDFSESKSKSISVRNDGSYNQYFFDFSDNPEWRGRITRIRVDPAAGGNGEEVVGIQSVEIDPRGTIYPSPTGTVTVNATLDGSPWSGPVDYNVVGPQATVIGNGVPGTSYQLAVGSYTLYFHSGGPDALVSITPAQTQILSQNNTITFTLNFGGRGGGEPIPPTFSTSTSLAPSQPVINQPVTITTNVANIGGAVGDVIVDTEIYSSTGQKVFQNFSEHQNFSFNQTQSYSSTWTPSASGQYTVKVGTFSSNWAVNYHWNDNSQTFNVGGSSPPPPPSTYEVQIWWPTNGATVSGTVPFKAMLTNMPVSQYVMYWQVDNGQLNLMTDNFQDYPHKEAPVDVSGWNWRSGGPYNVTFVAKDMNGNFITQATTNIYIGN
jgi:hypothetical protein